MWKNTVLIQVVTNDITLAEIFARKNAETHGETYFIRFSVGAYLANSFKADFLSCSEIVLVIFLDVGDEKSVLVISLLILVHFFDVGDETFTNNSVEVQLQVSFFCISHTE